MRIESALLAALLLAAGAALARDDAADPMRSQPCLDARAELEALLAQPRGSSERLAQARRRTAQACLGSSDGARQRSGAPEPPQAVPPTIAIPRQPVQPPALAPAPPPVPVPRPTAITVCDPSGCWDSQGRRLNQQGPLLIGPGGLCTGLGGIVTCP
jgi:hypothetical protein